MPTVVVCPKCQARYQLPETAVGKTIQCKKCSAKFLATPADQGAKVAASATSQAKTGAATSTKLQIDSRYPVGASTEALARLGLGAPLRRQPDPMGGPFSPPPKDILGNFAADPGFVIPGSDSDHPDDETESEKELTGIDAIVDNPFAKDARKIRPVNDAPPQDGYGYHVLSSANSMVLMTYAIMVIALTVMFSISTFGEIDWSQGGPAVGIFEISFSVFLWAIPFHFLAASQFSFQGHENLRVIGVKELKFSPLLAAFTWYIPLANFVLPLLTTLELAQSSSSKGEPKNWQKGPFPAEVLVWWILGFLFVGLLLAGMFFNLVAATNQGNEGGLVGMILTWGSLGCFILMIILFFRFSKEIEKAQEKMRRKIRKSQKQNLFHEAKHPYPRIYNGLAYMLGGFAVLFLGIVAMGVLAGEGEASSDYGWVFLVGLIVLIIACTVMNIKGFITLIFALFYKS